MAASPPPQTPLGSKGSEDSLLHLPRSMNGNPDDMGDYPGKRLRTSHACDVCRARKIRCNGGNPCVACADSNQECIYGSEANSRSKSDIILKTVLRVEQSLSELRSDISAAANQRAYQNVHSPGQTAPQGTTQSSPSNPSSVRNPFPMIQTPMSEDHQENNASFDNAVLDSMHISTTESILQWPHFDAFPSLRQDVKPIFTLEQSRPPMATTQSPMYPYVDTPTLNSILVAFEKNVNFWYPTLSQSQLGKVKAILEMGVPADDTVQTCLTLLVIALGCVSQAVMSLWAAERYGEDEEDKLRRARRAHMGHAYFQLAMKKIHVVHLELRSEATQCLFFTALYLASLVRPLQAWGYLSATAARCMMLLVYSPTKEDDEDQERLRRIFWSCYILESDYVAELSACPPSGIARIESSIWLPGFYKTHTSEEEREESSLYFLACISIRRLLNRVHQLLYARDNGAAWDTARFPRIVTELQHQLDEWHSLLPKPFSFTIDDKPTATEVGGFLRQRYLTCKAVIYRPYLMWMLSGRYKEPGLIVQDNCTEEILSRCKVCLDACLLHALNLRGFPQTVLVDMWICSLSMSGAMLILLAACQVPLLKEIIDPRVTQVGHHLLGLFEQWQKSSFGVDTPSVHQCLWVIREADQFIREVS